MPNTKPMFYVKLFMTTLMAAGLLACNEKSTTNVSDSVPNTPVTAQEKSIVMINTTEGSIKIELDGPSVTTLNFLHYANEGFYNDTQFHRVIKGFMIQGGGFTSNLKEKMPDALPIKNEGSQCGKNTRGTIAMARTSDPHSATAQFFINTADNAFLDFTAETNQGWGYCAFGHVIEGMAVVEKIESTPTRTVGGYQDVPVTSILIKSVAIMPS